MRRLNIVRLFVFSLCFCAINAFAASSLVNGIAFYVNGDPVTLLEVYSVQRRDKITQDVAVDRLINERLHEDEIKKRKIIVNDLEVEDEIAEIAKRNKSTLEQMKAYVLKNGGSWEGYKEKVKKDLMGKKLYRSISQESLRSVDDREIRGYYEANKREFLIPQSIDTIKFFSKDSAAIEQVIRSGGKSVPASVKKENEVLQTAALNPQIVLSFAQGEVGKFTPIFPIEDEFVTFLIKSKNNPVLVPFENARNIVMQKIMLQKEDYLIYEYFEKLRSNAKVDIVRLN